MCRIRSRSIYPTHARLLLRDHPDNTARLVSLLCHLEDETGRRYEREGGLSSFSDPDTGFLTELRLSSPYFQQPERLTLCITGAAWQDPGEAEVTVDLTAGTAAGLPEGVRLIDPEKLKTEYFGIEHFGVVCIFPLCEGESSIHVLDKNNKLVKIIKIQTTMWGSKDVEVENGAHPYVKPEVRVEAQDTQTKQNIEKELMQELKNRNGTRYTFDNQTRLFTMTFPDGRKGYEGTYKCRVDSLIMQTQSIIKKYGYEVSYKNKFLIIREDRTEEFCQRYPDSGVTSVTTQEIWRDYSILDIFP